MSAKDFDPYARREDRDARNRLGHAFVHGLLTGRPGLAAEAARELLAPAQRRPAYRDWLTGRLALYDQAQAELAAAPAATPLTLGLRLWRMGLFFEAHEALEQDWQAAQGQRRLALKALVQAVGSCIHAQRGAASPAEGLARRAGVGLTAHGAALVELPWLPALTQRLVRGLPGFIDDLAQDRPLP